MYRGIVGPPGRVRVVAQDSGRPWHVRIRATAGGEGGRITEGGWITEGGNLWVTDYSPTHV